MVEKESIREKLLRENHFTGEKYYGAMSQGGETDNDLDISLSLDVKAGFTLRSSQPSVGHLLSYLAIMDSTPKVIMEDGSVIQRCRADSHRDEFDDNTARLIAKQYNGIFFPAKFAQESFLLADFVEALRRCIPNEENKCGFYDEKFHKMIQEQGLRDLEQELAYLEHVGVSASRDIISGRCSTEGLVGVIHKKDDKGEDTTFFPTEGVNGFYEIRLGLSLEGFGYKHMNVSQRRMATKFDVYGNFKNDSEEASALSSFISSINPEDREDAEKNYQFSIDYKTREKGNKVEQVILRLESPSIFLESNYEMEKPVMQTRELLPIFTNAADTVHAAIKKAKDYQKAKEKQQYDEVARAMGLHSDSKVNSD